MPYQDVSIDIETLGVTSRSAIVSIGACMFDARTGDVDKDNTFYRRISWETATLRRNINADTLNWWVQQNIEALKEVTKPGGEPLKQVLADLAEWVPHKCKPWGNGAVFDIGMIEDCYNQYGIPIPWKFWDVRDMRTVVDIGRWLNMDKDKIQREGVHHNALDDAIYQARVIGLMQKTILKRAS